MKYFLTSLTICLMAFFGLVAFSPPIFPSSKTETSAENGKSAYELALENGFKGTLEEWLVSLKGDAGATSNNWLSLYDMIIASGEEEVLIFETYELGTLEEIDINIPYQIFISFNSNEFIVKATTNIWLTGSDTEAEGSAALVSAVLFNDIFTIMVSLSKQDNLIYCVVDFMSVGEGLDGISLVTDLKIMQEAF